jgi:hypothetical protein
MWLLMAVVCAAWLQQEGLALIDRRWPALRPHLAQNAAIARIGRALMRLKAHYELDETSPARG